MSAAIEPKKVLHLINSMGYKNVSATELKEFTKDLKKLMKYEQNHKNTIANVPKVIHAPENVINVTIIKEASPTKKCDHQPATIGNPVQKAKVQTYTQTEPQSDGAAEKRDSDDTSVEPAKQKKKLLRLSRHIKPKNTNIIYKKGIVSEVKNGVLIRNTPTDLYKKYQEDWVKFKSFIPGENSRSSVRRSVRKKMQQKDEDNAKVYVHFPDETGDH